MDAHSVVDDWDAVPFDGGFGGIDALASRRFSGAVETGGTWLFLRDGEALAVVSDLESTPRPGDIGVFEDAVGQQYEAPKPAAATLAAMLALDGEVRGRYFTDDTPLDAVDETLSEGGFTGYVELSENVLSGDYYSVYVDGEVDHIAFVGSSQLLSGEEAESRAAGEVGIYDVVAVQLPRPTVPDPEPEGDTGAGATSAQEPESEPTPELEPGSDDAVPASDPPSDPESTDDTIDERPEEPELTSEPTDAVTDDRSPVGAEQPTPDDTTTTEAQTVPDEDSDEGKGPESATQEPPSPIPEEKPDADATERETPPADDSRTERSEPANGPDSGASAGAGRAPVSEPDEGGSDDGAGGIEAVTTRTVPSLDPENSGRRESETADPDEPERSESREKPQTSRPASSTASTDARRDDPRIGEYESQIDAYESRIAELEAELTDADSRIEEYTSRIEDLEAELESVRAERDDLRQQVGGHGAPRSESMTPAAALSGTSLFVRERTREDGTLEDAHAGDADREDVRSNLRIEYHTSFDDADVSVEGDPFESWLRSSDTYAFVEWLAFELLFEIRSTGTVEELRPLYDALPAIDRVGFDETIAVGDGTEGRETEFDIVVRNKKGNPLLVAAFDTGRDPTRADDIEPLVTDASDVCLDHDTLAAAVAITSSYFESDAMAVVEEATSTSLLGRNKYRSYVKLSRANGFHLCLVEARDESFNLALPEL